MYLKRMFKNNLNSLYLASILKLPKFNIVFASFIFTTYFIILLNNIWYLQVLSLPLIFNKIIKSYVFFEYNWANPMQTPAAIVPEWLSKNMPLNLTICLELHFK